MEPQSCSSNDTSGIKFVLQLEKRTCAIVSGKVRLRGCYSHGSYPSEDGRSDCGSQHFYAFSQLGSGISKPPTATSRLQKTSMGIPPSPLFRSIKMSVNFISMRGLASRATITFLVMQQTAVAIADLLTAEYGTAESRPINCKECSKT